VVDVTAEVVVDEGVCPSLDAAGRSQTATTNAMASRSRPPVTRTDLRSDHPISLRRFFFVAPLLVRFFMMSQGTVYRDYATTGRHATE
jgi:hypothetical protein